MKKITKYSIVFMLAAILIGGAWYSGFKYNIGQTHTTESSSAIMNRIEKVFKLVAVEGHISEIYSYKDYYYYDISPFRKKALIRVNAKASVGYDFDKVRINLDDASKTIRIDSFPPPSILSIEHDLEYYDIDEGSFNNFSEAEFTKLNAAAKKYALEKAKESDLFAKAEEQKAEMVHMLEYLAQGQGYKIVIKNKQNNLLD